jgi:hypothetical protein
MERKLRGWIQPHTAFVVLRDQDAGDCRKIKSNLVEKCRHAGKPEAVVRIACRELESWYFGDLKAVELGLKINGLTQFGNNRKYRVPDAIVTPSQELLKITKFCYEKIAGSREIGCHLNVDPAKNTSISFGHFLSGIKRALASIPQSPKLRKVS